MLTRALAVLGIAAAPLTGVTGILVAVGAAVDMMFALLIFAQIGLFAVAFAVIHRRS